MRVERRDSEGGVEWVLGDVRPEHEAAVRDLAFVRRGGVFVRRFPGEARHVDRAWPNFERHAEALVLQAAREAEVPWREALSALLHRVARADLDWWLAGSAALAVRGLDVGPRDFDLVTDAAGAQRLGELLADVLVEPVAPVTGWFCDWFGRAFLGARVEWVGGVHRSVDEPEPTDFGPAAAARLATVRWDGFDVRVPPLDLQLAVTERRGLAQRAARIRALL